MTLLIILILTTFLLHINIANAGIVAQGVCYTACNSAWGTCLAASGLAMGGGGPVGWWAWLTSAAAACSALQGTCMAACTPLLLAPTP